MASTDDVWLVDFGAPFPDEPAAIRPALVLGPPSAGTSLPVVLVAPMTTTNRMLRLHVEVEPDASNGLDRTSYIQCELLRAVSRRRLVRFLGKLDVTASDRVGRVTRALLGY